MTEERKNKKGIGVTARLVSITMVPIICILFTLSFIAISDISYLADTIPEGTIDGINRGKRSSTLKRRIFFNANIKLS